MYGNLKEYRKERKLLQFVKNERKVCTYKIERRRRDFEIFEI
jgi:hypothetical protein